MDILDEILKNNDILFLPNVHLNNVLTVEQQFDQYINDMVNDSGIAEFANEIIVYSKIPSTYNTKTWPINTNLKCWNCDCFFNNIPLFVPAYIPPNTESDGTLTIHVDKDKGGNFCSPNCTYTYILHEYPIQQRQSRIYMLKVLLEDIYPGRRFNLSEIKSRTNRIEYGGELSLDEFKKML